MSEPFAKIDFHLATIADVFAHLLEMEGHSGIDADKKNNYGYSVTPHYACAVWRGGGHYRGACPSCLALRKYRLDQGETESSMLRRYMYVRYGRDIEKETSR